MIFNNLRDKIPKKFVAFILALTLVVLSPFVNLFSLNALAASRTVSVWRSNRSEIGRWNNIPSNVYVVRLSSYNSNFSTHLLLGMNYGTQQWESALGFSTNVTFLPDVDIDGGEIESYVGSGIQFFGGTAEQIDALLYNFNGASPYYNHGAVTRERYVSYNYDQLIHQGDTNYGHVLAEVRGFIKDSSQGTGEAALNHYRALCTHELGHAYGWLGESIYGTDVMYSLNCETDDDYTLNSYEIQHLKQYYDFAD